ncbi:hypothetical protein CAEBREN_22169 [Caenorhabditis brenneri]|uniref:CUB-like domain-containing protein n=1 Tax=Caenorhabditis brenneri TaxID=135651 RepID=G0N267_CAEBE|nr:hypothetical protein CAEBREN_22169 [Caenorhabditis brenneri]
MSQLIFLSLALWISSAGAYPQLLPLTKFSSSDLSFVNGTENGALLFVASADNNKYLRNIKITNGVTTITMDHLNDVNRDGTPKSLEINGDLYISTANNETITKSLTGNIYITTRAQAKDPGFSVIVVKHAYSFYRDGGYTTVVILNTQLQQDNTKGDQPSKVTYVTDIQHSPNTPLHFQWGIPPSDAIITNIFYGNPVSLYNGSDRYQVFFEHVEPIQIGLDCWYITAKGPFVISLDSKYVDDRNYKTTASNTTGIILSNGQFENHFVDFQPEMGKKGTSGVFYSSVINPNSNVGIYLEAGTGIDSTILNGTIEARSSFYTSEQATRLTVNTTTPLPGSIYIQYFTISGDIYPLTDPPRNFATTTVGQTPVPTSAPIFPTTQGSSFIFRAQSLILLFVFVFLF